LEKCLREGLRHRAVAVLVIRGDGRMVIQVRSKNDHWQPGRWTLSCTGHVGAGESYAHAARRELAEELGLNSTLVPLTKVFLPKVRGRGSVEFEVVHLFKTRTDAPLSVDPVELDGVRLFDPSELARLMEGRRLTPDAKMMLREYARATRVRPSSRRRRLGPPRPAREKR